MLSFFSLSFVPPQERLVCPTSNVCWGKTDQVTAAKQFTALAQEGLVEKLAVSQETGHALSR